MKRFLLACLLAVPVAAFSQAQAHAWCKFGLGCSLNIDYASGGKGLCWHTQDAPLPCCAPAPCAGGYGWGGYAGAGYGMAAPYAAAPAAPMAPAPAAVAPTSWYGNPAYQPAAYYYPSTGYGYYTAPAYWYGY